MLPCLFSVPEAFSLSEIGWFRVLDAIPCHNACEFPEIAPLPLKSLAFSGVDCHQFESNFDGWTESEEVLEAENSIHNSLMQASNSQHMTISVLALPQHIALLFGR